MFHLSNGCSFEFVLNGDGFHPHHLHVLPHLLNADLDLPCNRKV
jgi:hypothetical protein